MMTVNAGFRWAAYILILYYQSLPDILSNRLYVVTYNLTRRKGALAGVRVHKFKVGDKQHLLAYTHEKKSDSITLLALSSHENFYRDLSNLQQ